MPRKAANRQTAPELPGMEVEQMPIDLLRPHPRNYRSHPPDQIAHIQASIEAHGFYRPVVVTAREATILAGHGLVEAARGLGITHAPVVRMPYDEDDPRALKLLAADNELTRFAENDDRALTELLKAINETSEGGLSGTGYDEAMLANLVMVTRPASEVEDFDEAAHWVGMPEYDPAADKKRKLVISFVDDETRELFVQQTGIRIDKREAQTWTTRWPFTEREDLASLRFEGEADEDG